MNSGNRYVLACSTTIALVLGGCQSPADTRENTVVAAARQGPPDTTSASSSVLVGPEMLTTVGLYDHAPVTSIRSQQGTFAIEKVDETDTLTLNGKPVRYTPQGADAPQPVAANDGITLVGVFELPQESVAWVTIIGGTACAGSHVLVGARSGSALPGQEIPGCDDRGTMRRSGNKIIFQAGGSEGFYEDGLISITTKPPGDNQSPLATAM